MATGNQFDLPYMVEQWDDADWHVEELIAKVASDHRVARAAFEEAAKRHSRASPTEAQEIKGCRAEADTFNQRRRAGIVLLGEGDSVAITLGYSF
jgi:hypothetical protein